MANAVQELEVEIEEGSAKEEAKRQADLKRQDRARQIQGLELQRENILSQRTSNASRRTALEAALAQIEAQIETLK
jgi:hypothetical protein